MRPPVNPSRQRGYHDDPRPLTEDDLRIMHLPRRFWDAKRADFPVELRQRDALDRMAANVVDVMETGDPSLLLFYGDHGTGKTAAAAVIAKAVRAHRYSTFFLGVADILRTFPTDTFTEDGESTYRERAYQTELLVLDGLGSGYAKNDFVASETTSLLRYRQDNLMLTVVTTALDFEVLKKRYGEEIVALMQKSSTLVNCPQKFGVEVSDAE